MVVLAMADVKWIKITTDIFDDEKILLIESLPDSYAIITVWFKLLCMAGKQNNSGVFMMGQIAYTDKMLATIFRMKESTVTMALQTFKQFGMIEIIDGVITIPNWEKHQSLDKLEFAREQTRQRVARHREKQKQLAECNATCNADVTQCNADRIDKEEDKEIDKDKSITCKQVVDLYHSICKSFPIVRSLSDSRKRAIGARLKAYTLDDFKTMFENAEASSFLKGSNDRNWSANLDWLIADKNMAKVLEGYYNDKPKQGRKEPLPGWGPRQLGSAEAEALQRMMQD
jgi:predicted phage replisome organizer